jgi:hypothetical protein
LDCPRRKRPKALASTRRKSAPPRAAGGCRLTYASPIDQPMPADDAIVLGNRDSGVCHLSRPTCDRRFDPSCRQLGGSDNSAWWFG